MQPIYRILDANSNRAREAMRVVEDFARFILNDEGISATAKDLRSRLREVMSRFPAEALLACRDTAGDVGASLRSPTEYDRPDAAAVATAACKRLTEAIRTLEEYAKVVAPDAAAELESMRYEAYDLERRLGMRLSAAGRFGNVRLYVLLTCRLCRLGPPAVVEAAIAGGADCIQVREKDMPDTQLLSLARRVRRITRRRGVPLIINDRPDIAAIVVADGVHLGQDDLPIAETRRVTAPGTIIGKSTHNIVQARSAVSEGADYIGVGPMFPTMTKDTGPGPVPGQAYLRQVADEIPLPHVAIGGITGDNVSALVASGARRVAVCSAIIGAADPAAAAETIKKQLPSDVSL